MSSYFECDNCGGSDYHGIDPFVEVRVQRPSDPSDMCCIMAGHRSCFPGAKTSTEWEDYIESPEAMKNGHLFLT